MNCTKNSYLPLPQLTAANILPHLLYSSVSTYKYTYRLFSEPLQSRCGTPAPLNVSMYPPKKKGMLSQKPESNSSKSET